MGELPLQEDVDREVDFHLDMRTRELMEEGWERSAARREALRRFGDPKKVKRMMKRQTKSRDRAVRRSQLFDGLVHDLAFAFRNLAKSPAFAFVALATLALGIGANTAVFSVVHGVLLTPLPLPDPSELVRVEEWNEETANTMDVAWGNYLDWRDEARGFESLAAYTSFGTPVLGGDRPVRARLVVASRDFWDVFPVSPVRGRLTTDAEHVGQADPATVVSYAFWQDALGGRPLDELRLEVAGLQVSVAGVLPEDFVFPSGGEVWLPAELMEPSVNRTAHNWNVVARLADGASLDRASRDLDALTRRILANVDADPNYLADGTVVTPLRDRVTGSARGALYLLLGAAGLVLLVACTNLASTLLARGSTRERELAVRASLGAVRARIVRQLTTESLLVSALGAAAGVGVAWLVLEGLQRAGPASVPRLQEVGIDAPVLMFTAGVALFTTVLFGLFPALRLTRGNLAEGLREGSRGNAGGRRGGLWKLLVGTEIALALLLLVGSGLLLRSFGTLLRTDPGFSVDGVMTAGASLSSVEYPDYADHARWYRETLRELESRPEIETAGVISSVPVGGFFPTGRLELDGDLSKHANAGYMTASRGFFEALDIPLVRGRLFDERDRADAPHVAVVSRSFVDRYWPGEDPIGRQVSGGGMDQQFDDDRFFATVIGVVGDIRHRDLDREPYPTVYVSYRQRPFRVVNNSTLVVEAADGDAVSTVESFREVLSTAEPDLPLRFRSLEEVVSASLAQRTFVLSLMAGFALLALLLAAVGVYGVVSYSVARRRREMGIRLALGAAPGAVRGLVLRSALAMVAGGLLVGTVIAVAAAGVLEGLLFEVEPRDPWTLAGVLAVLILSALLASWIPAVRSTRVNPVEAMRAE